MFGAQELQRSALPEGVRYARGSSRALLAAGTRLRTIVFLLAVVAINYTWSRPSPVDFLFFAALLLTLFSQQRLRLQNLILFGILMTWLAAVFISSISLTDNPDVRFELLALTSVVFIAITSCLVTADWRERDLQRFVSVYVFATVIAAIIGTVGFVIKDPNLTWAERPRAFLDDPDMLGAFLIPGILGSLYMIAEKRKRFRYSVSLLVLSVAELLTFSRASIVSAIVWAAIYFLFLNRRNPVKAVLSALVILVPLVLAGYVFYIVNDTYAQMIADRFTLAENYDLGHFGRYNRYLLALPLILDHPLGIGLLEITKYFPEAIHNVWMASFLYFGWMGGIAWTLLLMLSVQTAWYNWRRSRNGLFLLILFSWLSVISCSMLHEGERWRFMWMLTGMLWGLNYRNFLVASDDVAGRAAPVRYRNAA
jgi:hypothetical protein